MTILIMTAQVLFFDVFSEKDPHLNAVEIESKNKEQLKGIKDQGEKQLDAIKKNNELKDDEKKCSTLKRWIE